MTRSKREKTYTGKNGKFKKGNPGRPKGTKDKFTDLKTAFLSAFEGLGGARGLEKWANESKGNRGQFYQMITKMLPTNVDIDAEGNIIVNIISRIPRSKKKKKKDGNSNS